MRIEGWESLLNDHIERAAHIEFAWGVNDCALWCADWGNKATGTDFASHWRGLYSSEDELAAILSERGFSSAAGIVDAILESTAVPFAQRGDIVQHFQGCLGICNGMHGYFLMERGVTRIRTRDCIKAWRVR